MYSLLFGIWLFACGPKVLPELQFSPPSEAQETSSGLRYQVLKKGKGKEYPTENSIVTVHYTGWLSDGSVFDSSIERGQSATFPLNRVIPGWTEGVQLMREGEKAIFWIPVDLAYGKNASSSAPQGDLIFEIELISIITPE